MSELGKLLHTISKESTQNVHRTLAIEYLEQLMQKGLPDLTANGYAGRKVRYVHERRIGFLWESVPPGVFSVTLPHEIVLNRFKEPNKDCNVIWKYEDIKAYFSKMK